MKTILYQAKPAEGGDWAPLSPDFVPSFRNLGYSVRELVLRSEAETTKVEHYNAALAQAAQIAAEHGAADVAEKIRKQRMRQEKVPA